MARHLTNLIAAMALVAGAESAAYAGGTEEQREACTPDAFRLCASAMPDESRVESCLRSAGPKLSAACHQVFYPAANSNAQMARGQAAPRERAQPSAPQRPETPSMPQMPPGPASDGD